jgi:hypothetical protein
MLQLAAGTAEGGQGGAIELAGSLTRQTELEGVALAGPSSHVANVGRAVEDMEIKLRNLIGEVGLRRSFCRGIALQAADRSPFPLRGAGVLRQDQGRPQRRSQLWRARAQAQ